MARTDPQLTPSGSAARRLYAAMLEQFTPVAFFNEVAKRSGNTAASEKGSFYRYVRGGPIPRGRLAIYSDILGVDVELITRHTAAVVNGRAPSDSRLEELLERVEEQAAVIQAMAEDIQALKAAREAATPQPRKRRRAGGAQ